VLLGRAEHVPARLAGAIHGRPAREEWRLSGLAAAGDTEIALVKRPPVGGEDFGGGWGFQRGPWWRPGSGREIADRPI
jgi:hypothetical protein